MTANLGKEPELKWLDIDDLTIEKKYQRGTQSKRSQNNIANIIISFDWSKFGVIVVAKLDGGRLYSIIDGQHRVEAVLQIESIDKVPCCIVESSKLVDQAKTFVGINKNRVALHSLHQFHADVAAGDLLCMGVKKMCDRINITIPKTPPQGGGTKPREIQATGALKALYKKFGPVHLSNALKIVAEAYPETKGQMRPMFIQTLTRIYHAAGDKINHVKMLDLVKDTDPEHLQETARLYIKVEGGSTLNAMIKIFLKDYNVGTLKANKIVTGD